MIAEGFRTRFVMYRPFDENDKTGPWLIHDAETGRVFTPDPEYSMEDVSHVTDLLNDHADNYPMPGLNIVPRY